MRSVAGSTLASQGLVAPWTSTAYAVGALAAASGLTVRTLHRWDAIGLPRPAERRRQRRCRATAAAEASSGSSRVRALGEEGMRKAQDDWAQLIAEVEAEREAGTDPADPRVQALMERWQALVQAFTGGDPGITASLKRMYERAGRRAGLARRDAARPAGVRREGDGRARVLTGGRVTP